jgi:AhpD family alkylhydroperoxidase
VDVHQHAKAMAASVGYTAKLGIDGQLAQLLQLRVAQLNPCSYCLILHNRAAVDHGITPECNANLPSWRESTLYGATSEALTSQRARVACDPWRPLRRPNSSRFRLSGPMHVRGARQSLRSRPENQGWRDQLP